MGPGSWTWTKYWSFYSSLGDAGTLKMKWLEIGIIRVQVVMVMGD